MTFAFLNALRKAKVEAFYMNRQQADSIFEEKLKEIILTWKVEQQEDFLRVYPAFKTSVNIITFWTRIYTDVMNKLKIQHELLKPMNLKDALKNLENSNLKSKRLRALDFLMVGVSMSYLDMSFSDIGKVIALMRSLQEDSAIINSLTMHLQQLKIDPRFTGRKTLSNISLTEVLPHFKNTKENSARPDLASTTDVLDISSYDFAYELSRRFAAMMQSITTRELLCTSMNDKVDKITSPAYKQLIDEFDKISYMVPTELVVKRKSNDEKLKVIKKFLSITRECLLMNNFCAVYALILGLGNRSVSRMKCLWKQRSKHTKRMVEFEEFISPVSNFSNYRKALELAKTNVIPHMALFTSDIKHLLEFELIDTTTNDFNWKIYNCLLKSLKSFERFKKTVIGNFVENKSVICFIDGLIVCMDDPLLDKMAKSITGEGNDTIPSCQRVMTSIAAKKIERTSVRLNAPSAKEMTTRKRSPRDQLVVDSKVRKEADLTVRKEPGKRLMIPPLNIPKRSTRHLSIVSEGDLDGAKRLFVVEPICEFPDRSRSKSVGAVIVHDPDFITNLCVEKWTVDQVIKWLSKINMDQYCDNFKREAISGYSLIELTRDELKNELGVTVLGHRIEILKHIKELRSLRS